MNPRIKDRLADAASQAQWGQAVALLQTCDAVEVAEAMGGLPFDQQQTLFATCPWSVPRQWWLNFPITMNTCCYTRGRLEKCGP